jgi:hypothetical protein
MGKEFGRGLNTRTIVVTDEALPIPFNEVKDIIEKI